MRLLRKCPFLGHQRGLVIVAKAKPKDNSSFAQKKALRKRALADLAALGISAPVVLESHGGTGKLWAACYEHLPVGVVMEKSPDKAARLGLQRPHWRVYETECVAALEAGIASDLAIDLLDLDPYGSCWPALGAFMSSRRTFAPRMAVVINDGLRQALSLGKAWTVKELAPYVERFGNDSFYDRYEEIARVMFEDTIAHAGYGVERYASYMTGANGYLLHVLAILSR